MSIASEITRLQTAKTELKTAIESKGVTVPSDTKLDGYADLVDSIEQGGGSDEDVWYIVVSNIAKYILMKQAPYNMYSMFDASAIRDFISQNPNFDCWLEYKGEKYYVTSFSNNARITKQGSPQKFYNGDYYNAVSITPDATDGVYILNINDE